MSDSDSVTASAPLRKAAHEIHDKVAAHAGRAAGKQRKLLQGACTALRAVVQPCSGASICAWARVTDAAFQALKATFSAAEPLLADAARGESAALTIFKRCTMLQLAVTAMPAQVCWLQRSLGQGDGV